MPFDMNSGLKQKQQFYSSLLLAIIQFKAIFSRDYKLRIRYRFAFLSSYLWPFIFPMSFVFMGRGLSGKNGEGLSNFVASAGTTDYTTFLIIGSLFWLFFDGVIFSAGSIFRNEQVIGILDTHWSLPISKYMYILLSTISSISIAIAPIVVSCTFFILFGLISIKGSLGGILIIIFALLPFSIGLLLILSGLTLRYKETSSVRVIIRSCLSILCGFLFPVSCLWHPIRKIAELIPLTRIIHAFRTIAIEGQCISACRSDLSYALIIGAAFLIFGCIYLKNIIQIVRMRGITGSY
jgi:ABC-2 type transport system permease protein